MSVNTPKEAVKPPPPPTTKSAKYLATGLKRQPYVLSGYVPRNEDGSIDFENVDFDDQDVCIVLAGGMKGGHMMDYINIYNEEFETTVNKIMFYFAVVNEAKVARDENREPHEAFIPKYDEYGRFITPFGNWRTGSLVAEMLELASFLLSRYGRIVGVDEKGKFELEPITQREVLDAIDYDSLIRVYGDNADPEAQEQVFFELLTVSNLINLEESRDRIRNGTGEDSGNSPESKGAG